MLSELDGRPKPNESTKRAVDAAADRGEQQILRNLQKKSDEANRKAESHWLGLGLSGAIILAFFAFQLTPSDAIYGWTGLAKVAIEILSPFAFIYLVATL